MRINCSEIAACGATAQQDCARVGAGFLQPSRPRLALCLRKKRRQNAILEIGNPRQRRNGAMPAQVAGMRQEPNVVPSEKPLKEEIAPEKDLGGPSQLPCLGILLDELRPDRFICTEPAECLFRDVRAHDDDRFDPAIGLRTNGRKQIAEVADAAEPLLIAECEDEANADHAFAPRYHATYSAMPSARARRGAQPSDRARPMSASYPTGSPLRRSPRNWGAGALSNLAIKSTADRTDTACPLPPLIITQPRASW